MADLELIKTLRHLSGAGIDDCKKALGASNDDIQEALRWLRTQGKIEAASRTGRKTAAGVVMSYIHGEGRVGVLVQVDCETDFVARGDAFKEFCREVCLQVASMNPPYVSRESVPADIVERETTLLKELALQAGKPEKMLARIIEGQIGKWYSKVCLLDQPWVKDGARTVGDLLSDLVLKTGENIMVTRVSRFEAGTQNPA